MTYSKGYCHISAFKNYMEEFGSDDVEIYSEPGKSEAGGNYNSDVQHQNVSLALAISEDFLGENGVCRVHGGGFAGMSENMVE